MERPSDVDEHQSFFDKAAKWLSNTLGKSISFMIAVCLIILWATSGPIFDFNDTWQLLINTSTTVLTFLFLFLLQNSQNRDGKAIQGKLNAIAMAMIDIMEHDEISESDIGELKASIGLEDRESS